MNSCPRCHVRESAFISQRSALIEEQWCLCLRVSSDPGGAVGGELRLDQSPSQWGSSPGLQDQRRHHRSAPSRPLQEQRRAHCEETPLCAAVHQPLAGFVPVLLSVWRQSSLKLSKAEWEKRGNFVFLEMFRSTSWKYRTSQTHANEAKRKTDWNTPSGLWSVWH